jgi:hypothetical protein
MLWLTNSVAKMFRRTDSTKDSGVSSALVEKPSPVDRAERVRRLPSCMRRCSNRHAWIVENCSTLSGCTLIGRPYDALWACTKDCSLCLIQLLSYSSPTWEHHRYEFAYARSLERQRRPHRQRPDATFDAYKQEILSKCKHTRRS